MTGKHRAVLFTLTANPALDLSGKVERIVPNEKNHVWEERRDPGGNGINASRIAHRLGGSTLALGFLGGAVGLEVLELLDREGVPNAFTRIRESTRVNVTVSEISTHLQTRLSFPGPAVRKQEIRQLLAAVRRSRQKGLLLLGGSLPHGLSAAAFFRQVTVSARSAGWDVAMDVPASVLRSTLSAVRPVFIKPNDRELEEWTGRKLPAKSKADLSGSGKRTRLILDAASQMAHHAALVLVSLGEEGVILVTRLGGRLQAWKQPSPKIRARGTVGAGDSFIGAFSTQLLKAGLHTWQELEQAWKSGHLPQSVQEALRWGVAAGAATAQAIGTAQASRSQIEKLRRSSPPLQTLKP